MISSIQNGTIRRIWRLRKRGERERERAFLAEGHRSLAVALGSAVHIGEVFCTPRGQDRRLSLLKDVVATGARVRCVSEGVMAYLTDHDHPPDLLAVAGLAPVELARALEAEVVMILASVHDPAVAGGIMAAAAGFGAGSVVATRGSADLFAPAAVRAGAGAHFVLGVCQGARLSDLSGALGARRVAVLDAAGCDAADADLRAPVAIVVTDEGSLPGDPFPGSERVGVGGMRTDVRAGPVSRAAIVLHEAMRQSLRSREPNR